MRTSDRPIAFRRRPDLEIIQQRFGMERRWVVKDPLSLRFCRLNEREYALFELLDGEHSIDDLVTFYEAKFPPDRLRPEEVARFVNMLYRSQLLIPEREGHGIGIHERGQKRARGERLRRWTNPLAIQFRGIDPAWLFDRLYPFVRPLLSRPFFLASCLFILAAVATAAANWRTLIGEISAYESFFTPTTMLALLAILGGVKILHEFGHGLVCKHFGGHCHELGVMILVFTPCLYCNVTDSYRFPDKRRRAAVGAAGIYVELLLASLAVFIWRMSEPGLLHQLCLGVMTVCSVSTVVFNGNPLMRYDGYYILSDLVEVPNLAERCNAVVRNAVLKLFSREQADRDPLLPVRRRGWYAAYAVASFLYRISVTFTIILILVAVARPYKLEHLARALGIFSLVTLVGVPLYRLFAFLRVPGRLESMRPGRLTAASIALAGLVSLLFAYPLPHRVLGPMALQPYRPDRLFVDAEGIVVDAPLRYGSTLQSGDGVVRLVNRDLELQLEELRAEQTRRREHLDSLKREQFDHPSAAGAIPQTESLLAAVTAKLAEKQRDRDRLKIASPRSGVLYPPPLVAPSIDKSIDLPAWTGRPLDPINVGCRLEPGTLVGEVGDPRYWEAWIVIDQEDVSFLHVGDRVDILLESFTETPFQGTIDEISVGELTESPRQLSNKAGGELTTKTGAAQNERPASTSYSIRVRIENERGLFRSGWRGTARISLPPAPLAARIGRWAARTFHFHL